MSITIRHVTIDCADPQVLATFWSNLLDSPLMDGMQDVPNWGGIEGTAGRPSMLFQQVPEPKTVKNRVHVDLVSDDRAADVERAISLGATKLREHDEFGARWTVCQDPEGNEFCIAEA